MIQVEVGRGGPDGRGDGVQRLASQGRPPRGADRADRHLEVVLGIGLEQGPNGGGGRADGSAEEHRERPTVDPHVGVRLFPDAARLGNAVTARQGAALGDRQQTEPELCLAIEVTQPLREDVVTERNRRDDYQKIAPATEAGLYLVPKVIE